MEGILKIALIDDDPIFRLTTTRMFQTFKKCPVEVFSFQNGLEAKEYFRKQREDVLAWPHIMFVDINMPFMSGWEFLAEMEYKLSPKELDMHIYMLTSSTSMTDRDKSTEFKFLRGYLTKPIRKEKLMEVLKVRVKELEEID